jgi:hypothetical protein
MAFLDKLNVVIIERGFVGRTDSDAIAHGLTLCRTHAIEITLADRLVARLLKGARHHVAANSLTTDAPRALAETARRRPMERIR